MHITLLIDEIVRQTTVLIAQVSTAAGVRAPLASIADQVFYELARELESQGVRRTVVADMFGLALRSYQLKFRRLAAATRAQKSMWEDVHRELARGSCSKAELQTRVQCASVGDLTTVLNDLVGSGLAFVSGRGPSAVYGLTTERDRAHHTQLDQHQALTQWVLQMIATERATTRRQLQDQLSDQAEAVEGSLRELLDSGLVEERAGRLRADTLDIPVGAEYGWEAAVSDHFRAVVTAISGKLRHARSTRGDKIGGGTYSLTVHPDHPHQARVYGLLDRVRAELEEVWGVVNDWNQKHPPPEGSPKVTFYFGQSVTADDESESENETTRDNPGSR